MNEQTLIRVVRLYKSSTGSCVYFPKRVMDRLGLKVGDEYALYAGSDGTLTLRPIKAKR
jgi:antitoxin component of MazEF toxin-antitoxin module